MVTYEYAVSRGDAALIARSRIAGPGSGALTSPYEIVQAATGSRPTRAGERANRGASARTLPDVHDREKRPSFEAGGRRTQVVDEHGVLVLIGSRADQHQPAEWVRAAGSVDVNAVHPPPHSSTSDRSDPRLPRIPFRYLCSTTQFRSLDTAHQSVTMRLVIAVA